MALMLSLADVEKARSIAERALKTINIREESEKLNIWVAYFNLENENGNPPEDAVMKIFQKALKYCDSKEVHLALLGMYQRTEQHKLASKLLDKMARKFKHSCKEIRIGDGDVVRALFGRAISLCVPPKKMKFLFKEYLEYEKSIGDEERIESVKKKALDYAESTLT